MKLLKQLIFFSLCASIAGSAGAQASEQPWYASGMLGFGKADDVNVDAGPILSDLELDEDLNFGVAIGRAFEGPYRLELEYSERRNDAQSLLEIGLDQLGGELSVRSFMLSAYADFPMAEQAWVPYVGAGAGVATFELDNVGSNFLRIRGKDDSALGFQVVAGSSFPMGENVELALDVRYLRFKADDIDYNIGPAADLAGESTWKYVGVGAWVRVFF
jgi:opacity protein-like surface antigen